MRTVSVRLAPHEVVEINGCYVELMRLADELEDEARSCGFEPSRIRLRRQAGFAARAANYLDRLMQPVADEVPR